MFFKLTPVSGNRKTGPIPVSTTSSDSCPDACPLKASNVCYAKHGHMRIHWDRVNRGAFADSWENFLAAIRRLPKHQLWRHNQAGDLPGVGDTLDTAMLRELVVANLGRNGFTYTHKPMQDAKAREAVRHANDNGFTVNLSADDLTEADELADLGIAPVVTVLPSTVYGNVPVFTPAGKRVVVCPATYRDTVTCATCGLCQKANRKVIVGFPVHGTAKRKYDRELRIV